MKIKCTKTQNLIISIFCVNIMFYVFLYLCLFAGKNTLNIFYHPVLMASLTRTSENN